ncbi:MAG: hypothetical protein OEV55_01100 [candidate division Zixibacteria bacterium]|nr:hypothetical protein [candidate division Zixibacteria bacterium]
MMQDHLRSFSELIQQGEALSIKKLVGEISSELRDDSLSVLIFHTKGSEGKIFKEEFEISGAKEFRLEAEALYWKKWLNYFGLVDGYKLTLLEAYFPDSLKEKIKTFELSGGPTEIWKKIYDWKRFLFMVKPKKLESNNFTFISGETKKIYLDDKKLVVE